MRPMIAKGMAEQTLNEQDAVDAVRTLVEVGGARFPCSGSDFIRWAKERGLLPER